MVISISTEPSCGLPWPTTVRFAMSRCRAEHSAHAALWAWTGRLDRVYFLAFLAPSRETTGSALTARLASPRYRRPTEQPGRLVYRSCLV